MPRDGSGNYTRTQSDYVFDTIIEEAEINSELNDIAAALSASVSADGQTTISGDQPMSTYKHTGVGNAALRNQYASAGQVQDGAILYAGTAGGTADALTVTMAPPVTALVKGMRIVFQAGAANNTGAATLAVNAVSAVALEIDGAALVADDIVVNKFYSGVYDGTAFQIDRLSFTPADSVTLDGDNAFTGDNSFAGTSLHTAMVLQGRGANVAGGTTIDISAEDGNMFDVTGTGATITGISAP